MARGPRYRVPFRRRREGKTNYYRRKRLLLSNLPRLIIRKTNNYIIAQIAEATPIGDKIIVNAYSSELKDFGWKGNSKNTPAAYLTGLLIAKKATKKGIDKVVPDIGLHISTQGAKIFAALKGASDGGLLFNLGEKKVPSEERIHGEHIASYAEHLESENPELSKKQFSLYIRRNLKPRDLPNHFAEVKEKIINKYEG